MSFNNEPEDAEYRNVIRNWIASKTLVEVKYVFDAIPGNIPAHSVSARGTLEVLKDEGSEELIVNWPSGRFRIMLLGAEVYQLGKAGELRAIVIHFGAFESLMISEALEIIAQPQ